MAEKINHWCVLCGTGYHACDTCDEIKSFVPWRKLTDTVMHYQVFTVLREYVNKLISKAEAKELLSRLDISDRDNYKDSAKKVLDEIFAEDNIARKNSKRKATTTKEPVAPEIEEVDSDNAEE